MFAYDVSIFLTSTAFVSTNAKYGISLAKYTVFLQNCPLARLAKRFPFETASCCFDGMFISFLKEWALLKYLCDANGIHRSRRSLWLSKPQVLATRGVRPRRARRQSSCVGKYMPLQ